VHDNRDSRVFDNQSDERFAAAGDDEIDILVQFEQQSYGGPIGRPEQLHAVFGQPSLFQRSRDYVGNRRI
jgi:hypothetical protein